MQDRSVWQVHDYWWRGPVFEQVVEGVSKIAKSLKLGSGFDPESQNGTTDF